MCIFARIMCPYTHINAYSRVSKPFFRMKKHGALPCFAFFLFSVRRFCDKFVFG